jgi:alkyldihydroxyacetonephosphate synthase
MADSDLVTELEQALGTSAVSTQTEVVRERSHDSWPLAVKWRRQGQFPYPADIVVWARSHDDVVSTLRIARKHKVPVTPWGRGSSVTGAPIPARGGIVLDLAGIDGEEQVNETNLTVTVPAGALGSELEGRLNARGFTLGHSPQSLGRSSVGGWVATRASGQFSSRYGSIEDLVVGLRLVLPAGGSVQLSAAPRAAVGPDLRQLFVGSEGTLGVITEVTLKLFPLPEHRVVEAFAFPQVSHGLRAMRSIAQSGARPFLLRLYDEDEAPVAMADSTFVKCVLFSGCEGPTRLAECEHAIVKEIVERAGGTSVGADPVEAWLARRFDFSAIENVLAERGGYAETIEVAHSWASIGDLYADLKTGLKQLSDHVLGHFSHVYGQGTSLYLIMHGRTDDDAAAQRRLEDIWETAMKTTLQHGGELSHHHGVGLARRPYLDQAIPDAHALLADIKGALDPAGILNPGKLTS